MSSEEIKVFLVDDHPVVLEGLTSGLGQYPGVKVVGSAHGAEQARRLLDDGGFDLLIMDLNLPEVDDGLALLRHTASHFPDCKIMVLTYSDRPEDIIGANRAGAHAYLLKDCELDEIAAAIKTVLAGGRPPLKPALEAALWQQLREVPPAKLPHGLNEREWKILQAMIRGSTNDEIANKLFISARAVRRCNTAIYGKLGVKNRNEAIRLALRENLFP